MEDQQPSFMPQTPQAPSAPQAPEPPKSSLTKIMEHLKAHKIWVLAAIVVTAAIAVAVVVLVGQNESSTGNRDTPQKTSFKNWLAPTKELKVGDNRYVSTCQVLTKDAVTDVFGPFSDDSIVMEDYLDENYTATRPSDAFEGRCSYELKNKKFRNITLESKQFADANETKKIFNFIIAKPDEVQSKINQLSSEAQSNAAAEAFTTRLKTSGDQYPELYALTYSADELRQKNIDGLILPDTSNRYVLFYQNSAYTFKITPVDKNMNEAELLAAYAELTKKLESNLKNPKLDQSPAPTIIGDTDLVTKTTKVLEPCAILNRANFAAITGTEQDMRTSRTSLPYEIQDIVQNTQLMVANSCERQSGKLTTGTSYSVTLVLRHATSVQGALAWLKEGEGTTPLQTNADQAFILNARFEGDYPTHYFRVGPYVANIDLTKTVKDGTFSGIDQQSLDNDQYVKAINVLVAELRKYQ